MESSSNCDGREWADGVLTGAFSGSYPCNGTDGIKKYDKVYGIWNSSVNTTTVEFESSPLDYAERPENYEYTLVHIYFPGIPVAKTIKNGDGNAGGNIFTTYGKGEKLWGGPIGLSSFPAYSLTITSAELVKSSDGVAYYVIHGSFSGTLLPGTAAASGELYMNAVF